MNFWIVFGAALVLSAFETPRPMLAQAPQPDASLTFEAASIKPATSGVNGVRGGCHGIDSAYAAEAPPLGRCVISDGRLSHLVGIAWDVAMPMLKTGPDWIQRGDERFDVVAKAEDPPRTTERQLLQMLQALLIERFQMKFHLEPVQLPGFALKVAKGGPKLLPTKSEGADFSFGPGGKPRSSAGMFKVRRCSTRELVRMLSLFGDRGPGVDRSDLAGLYDFTLTWDHEAGPTLETALREQLGLRMIAAKVQTSYFVIDSAKRPSEN